MRQAGCNLGFRSTRVLATYLMYVWSENDDRVEWSFVEQY